MYKFIKRFLLLIVAYHVLHTVVLWGLGIGNPVILSSIKELLWFGFILITLFCRRKQAWEFFINWKRLIVGLFLLIVRSIGLSFYYQVSPMTMIVGLKYDILPLLILVSAMFVGTLFIMIKDLNIRKQLLQLCSIVLIGGLLRQVLKICFPDFISALGYGPVGDYALASAPPLYYRTGPGGWMRLQGLFSGPNNYGYFLVVYFSVFVGSLFAKNSGGTFFTRFRRPLLVLFVGSLVRTLSRGVVIGVGVQLFLLIWFFKPHWKRWLGRIIGVGLVGIIGLSILKPASTIGHLTARSDGRDAFINQPMGHGLGSAGPAIHRAGVYLPENHYLQLLLDIGLPGLVLRIWVINGVIVCGRNTKIDPSDDVSTLRMLLIIGLLGLLVEGFFLHVFEDSMVNYLFLIALGVTVGMKVNQKSIS